MLENMVLVSGAQLFNGEVVKVVVYDDAIKNISNFKGIIEASGSTIIEGGR